MTDQTMDDGFEKPVFDLKTGEWRTWTQMQRAMEGRLSDEAVEEYQEKGHPRTGDPDAAVIDLAAGDEVTWREMEERVGDRVDTVDVPRDELSGTVTEDDVGKPVVDSDGTKIGEIHAVRDDETVVIRGYRLKRRLPEEEWLTETVEDHIEDAVQSILDEGLAGEDREPLAVVSDDKIQLTRSADRKSE